jgi:DNA-binding NarL/FixJ family response regulator
MASSVERSGVGVPCTRSAQQEETLVPAPGKLLSPREQELATLGAQGHTNAQIADRLQISVRTVDPTWTGSARQDQASPPRRPHPPRP